MTPPRRVPGTIPAALSRTGQDVPPSPDVAERNLAEVIGEAVALNLGQLLGPVLAGLARTRDACLLCAAKAKRAHDAWEADAALRRQAGEADPGQPDLGVTESFTTGMRGPVCWGCFDPDQDGPYPSLDDILPPPVD